MNVVIPVRNQSHRSLLSATGADRNFNGRCMQQTQPAQQSRARARLCGSARRFGPKASLAMTSRQAAPGRGDFCGDEEHSAGVGALQRASIKGKLKLRPPRLSERTRRYPAVDELLEIDVAECRARKHGPLARDLCGIAKGFGVDELARVLTRHGIGSWLVGIDGEMRAMGCKPDGATWAIAVEAPECERRTAMGVVELGDSASTRSSSRGSATVFARPVPATSTAYRVSRPCCDWKAIAVMLCHFEVAARTDSR